ncbi:hypothetical protein Cri9333_3409 [Crinalium epipsammum PCC 9333]|uniref:Uncharacterized protein n=1 Tax=Crinalium epipsammum PCC 9333 TaxID=1173022 RepID=K9W3B2_9CYAN|nr:hypothetical protein [Crinalium epipsammum]AFZ14237.1 hypothetical protein Cri9333_3409 [Crinalium epipsammum PCC 9333]
MRQSRKSQTELVAYIFSSVLGITIALYLLRGFGILTFLPGGVYLLLIVLTIATGILYGILKTLRY